MAHGHGIHGWSANRPSESRSATWQIRPTPPAETAPIPPQLIGEWRAAISARLRAAAVSARLLECLGAQLHTYWFT